jgi:SAM-dependent methyltransferase
MSVPILKMLRLALREALAPSTLARIPEPAQQMEGPDDVAGFHDAGAGSLLPVYHFNALAVDALARRGARVLDLGSGSGQFLSYLARHRPDLQIIGVECSAEMIRVGRASLQRQGLDGRVTLVEGDMRECARAVQGRIDVVSTVFSLHHLRSRTALLSCLRGLDEIARRDDANVWIFDFVRPRQRKTACEVPALFTPTASAAFQRASQDSLCAAWSFEELRGALRSALSMPLKAQRSRLLPLYQVHWRDRPRAGPVDLLWRQTDDLVMQTRMEAALFARLFRAAPQRRARSFGGVQPAPRA